eukprot:448243-Amphidinium_carterae.1
MDLLNPLVRKGEAAKEQVALLTNAVLSKIDEDLVTDIDEAVLPILVTMRSQLSALAGLLTDDPMQQLEHKDDIMKMKQAV